MPLFSEGGNPFDFSSGCEVNGMPASCSDVQDDIKSGATVFGDGKGHRLNVNPNNIFFSPRGISVWITDIVIPKPNEEYEYVVPVDQSRWVDVPFSAGFGNGFGPTVPQGRQRPDQGPNTEAIKKDFYARYGAAFNECLNEVFKSDAPAAQTLANAPTLITIEASSTLRTRAGVEVRPGGRVVGTIDKPKKGDGGAIRISEELSSTFGLMNEVIDREVLLTYGHELANLLDVRKNPKGKNGRSAGHVYGGNVGDTDSGQAVEDCLKGKLNLP